MCCDNIPAPVNTGILGQSSLFFCPTDSGFEFYSLSIYLEWR